ncbi:hypothetical protein SAMN05444580_10760 [Rhodococcus tukisamuensis]|uniref:YbaB/EbfC DNA-binding family protein n=1 Tax=Rhodococcus tukisamuensis TaxID=168276 RepID=A0A1G6Y6H0_9NOCA|nr:hypothetical protein SAMN05444580_10760 [Rhodococcus tukisamuensis]
MDRVVSAAATRLESLETALHLLGGLRARVTHGSGVVSVEVDENGGMTGLWISESLDRVDATDLGRAVTETAASAADVVSTQRDRILASLHDVFTY